MSLEIYIPIYPKLTFTLLLGIDCQANQVSATSEECNAAWGICNVRARHCFDYGLHKPYLQHTYSMRSISTVFLVGSRLETFAPLTIVNGNCKSKRLVSIETFGF